MDKNNFNNFTKMGKIVKAIEMELIPQGNTAKTIEEKDFDGYDASIGDLADFTVPYVDVFVRDLADRTLANVGFDFSVIPADAEGNQRGTRRYGDDAKIEDKITKAVVKSLNSSAKAMFGRISDINSAKFLAETLPAYVAASDAFSSEQKDALEDMAEEFKGKTEAMRSFFVTRITALEKWMPKRVMENLVRYRANTGIFSRILASEIGEDIRAQYPEIEKYTQMGAYSDVLTQEDIDAYNLMISGTYSDEKVVKKGLAMLVNEYNTVHKKEKKGLPQPKELYKQILMPKKKLFTMEKIETDEDAAKMITEAAEINRPAGDAFMDIVSNAAPEDIVIEYNNIHQLSHFVTGNHQTFPEKVREHELSILNKELEDAKTASEKRAAQKKIASFDRDICRKHYTVAEMEKICGTDILVPFAKKVSVAVKFAKVTEDGALLSLGEGLLNSTDATMSAKAMFDAWTQVRSMVRTVRRKGIEDGDPNFYNELDAIMSGMAAMYKAERKTIAYITRQPADIASKDRTLMGSALRLATQWMKPDGILSALKHTVIRRDGKYYYYILSPGTKPVCILGDGKAHAFAQKKGVDSSKALPKVSFTKAQKFFAANPDEDVYVIEDKVSKPLQITKELFRIKEEKLFTTAALQDGLVTEEEYRENLAAMIDFYKSLINVYEEYAYFDIKLRPTEEYANAGEFFAEINAQNFYNEWMPCNTEKIDAMVENGEALCFLIHNRNLYTKKMKKTAYAQMFLAALEDKGSDIILNSRPKIFKRKAVKKRKVTHKKGSILVNKRTTDGERIPDNIYEELYRYYNNMLFANELSKEARAYLSSGRVVSRKAQFDIIKDKRYTEDKWVLSISVTKNKSVPYAPFNVHKAADEMRKTANVLTLVRSDKDLLFYSVSDAKGNVLESASLNEIGGINYWKELKDLGELRVKEKSEEWKYDRRIKNMRDGYIGHAISAVVRKVLEYNALVVVEFIPENVKNKFDALDNTIFKGFEAKLVSRLSDLYFLDTPAGEPGSVTNPYQLCENSGNNFHDGIVYFTSAAYTANADHDTGFVNVFDLGRIVNVGTKKMFLSKFDSIVYDKTKNRFVFSFNYDNFVTKENPMKKEWQVLAGGQAIRFDRETKSNVYVPETAPEVLDIIKEHGHDINCDLAMLALDGELSGPEASALYEIFVNAVRGIVRAHDNMRKTYVSPITGESRDYAANMAINLTHKWQWLADEDSDGDWIDNIA